MTDSRPESAVESVPDTDMESNADNSDGLFQNYPEGNPNLQWVEHWGRGYIRSEDEGDNRKFLLPNCHTQAVKEKPHFAPDMF
jgi:hypothetical protein